MHIPHPRCRQHHCRCLVLSPTGICSSPLTRPSNPPLPTPMCSTGVHRVMLTTPTKSRQPLCSAWPCEQLISKHAIALGFALDNSTLQTYNSHLQSYLSFCKLHSLNLDPTPNTLSFYIVFMAHHIKPTCHDPFPMLSPI